MPARLVNDRGFSHPTDVEDAGPDGRRDLWWKWRRALSAELGVEYETGHPVHVIAGGPDGELLRAAATRLYRATTSAFELPLAPLAVTVFPDLEAYYRYVDHYHHGEGGHMLSAGVFIREGAFRQIALAAFASLEGTLAHELVHATLADLHLPRWLDEGLAESVSDRLLGRPPRAIPPELAASIADYFGRAGVDALFSDLAERVALAEGGGSRNERPSSAPAAAPTGPRSSTGSSAPC